MDSTSIYCALSPTILAVAALLAGWFSGYFDQERLRLKTEAQQLIAQAAHDELVISYVVRDLKNVYQEIQDIADISGDPRRPLWGFAREGIRELEILEKKYPKFSSGNKRIQGLTELPSPLEKNDK